MILLPYLLFFFYVHNVSFFSTPLSPSCEEGVLNPLPSPRPFQKGKGCNRPTSAICSKTYPSFLTVKEGSTSHLGLLPSGKKRKTALRCSEPLRYKVGGPSKVFAKLCGMGPPYYSLLWNRLANVRGST